MGMMLEVGERDGREREDDAGQGQEIGILIPTSQIHLGQTERVVITQVDDVVGPRASAPPIHGYLIDHFRLLTFLVCFISYYENMERV